MSSHGTSFLKLLEYNQQWLNQSHCPSFASPPLAQGYCDMGKKDFSFSKRCAFAYSNLFWCSRTARFWCTGRWRKKDWAAAWELREKPHHHQLVKCSCLGGFKGCVIFTTVFSFSPLFFFYGGSEADVIHSYYRVYIFVMLSSCCFSSAGNTWNFPAEVSTSF